MSFDAFKNGGNRCPHCVGSIKKTTEEFKDEIFNLFGNEYEILEDYQNSKVKILVRHNICNFEYRVLPNNILKNHKCPKCMNRLTKTTEQFIEEVVNLTGNEYKVLGNYINSKTKILMRHNICNYEYSIIPSNFLRGRRCPFCNESKGEKKIRNFLEDNNILEKYNSDDLCFQPQYKFYDLLSDRSNPLKFDFVILLENNIQVLIEYDGIQHFKWIEGMMTKDDFETIQYHDKLKNEYCNNKHIKLLRIPYWDFDNIEEILEKELHN